MNMKTHNIDITHDYACFIYDLLNEITFSSRRCRENPNFITVRTMNKWNYDELVNVMRFFSKIVNVED